MNVQGKNSNFRRIENLIVSAFMTLAEQKHYSQISVTELCSSAGINRTTFYKHYRGTWEIKERICENLTAIVARLHTSFKGKTFANNALELFQGVTEEIKENQNYYSSIFKMKGSHIFFDVVMDAIRKVLIEDKDRFIADEKLTSVAFNYIMGGIMNTYRAWYAGELKCTLDELAVILASFAQGLRAIEKTQENKK